MFEKSFESESKQACSVLEFVMKKELEMFNFKIQRKASKWV